MGLKISYKDPANWTVIENAQVIYWGVSRELNKLGRIIPNFLAPVTVMDAWDGNPVKVQVTRYESYSIQFSIKEEQSNQLADLASCDAITIEDIDNKITHTADNQTGESFVISPPEKIANTTNYLITITYKAKKVIIDKIAPKSNVVALVGNSTYNSKFSKLTYVGENSNIEIPWSDGSVKTLSQITNTGFNVLLYFTDSELSDFYEDYGQNTFTIDSVPVIKKLPFQPSPIAEGITKVIVQCVTVVNKTLDLSVTKSLQTNVINIDTSNNFYTDYPVDAGFQDTALTKATNEGGSGTLTHAITRQVSIVKFWMTNAELATFKPLFETSQAIKLNAVDVIENRIVKSSPLDFDINEVIVECLITPEVLYPQQ